MEMNKNQLTMAVIGGAGGVVALVVFALVWMKSGKIDALQLEVANLKSECDGLSAVDPATGENYRKNLNSISNEVSASFNSAANEFLLDEYSALEKSVFCERMLDDFKDFVKWSEGSVDKLISEDKKKSDDLPQFKSCLGDGNVPSSEKEKLKLVRQWCDFKKLMNLMKDAKVKKLERFAAITEAAKETSDKSSTGGQAGNQAPLYQYDEEKYEVKFEAKPAALVELLNLISANESEDKYFFIVEKMSFDGRFSNNEEIIKGTDNNARKTEGRSSKGRRGRNRNPESKEVEKQELAEKNDVKTFMTNPETAEPIKVTMIIRSVIFKKGGK
jgi:hypothetical protein